VQKISIIGTVGVPASYGGFETLVENLVIYSDQNRRIESLTVYCSAKAYPDGKPRLLNAKLRYIPLGANGVQSIPYDIWCLLSAVWQRADTILLLGVSGAIALPFVRIISSARVVTNIDGVEWKRKKWRGAAKWFLRLSEKLAVRFSHEVIADNQGIADYVAKTYGRPCHVIAYGGDHAIAAKPASISQLNLPDHYAFSLCRIEPENNTHLILEAFSTQSSLPLVFVGNWKSSLYGRELLLKFGAISQLYLLDPIYDLGILRQLRADAKLYIHGHSAGGTNPSLVEMMHFGVPIMAFDCVFNRYTMEGKGTYFDSSKDLQSCLDNFDTNALKVIDVEMQKIAQSQYTWEEIGAQYFKLLTDG